MKHKLLRDHLNSKKGDDVELTPEQENYFERVGLIKGIAEAEKTVVEPKKEKAVAKPKKEKKDKAGPNAKK